MAARGLARLKGYLRDRDVSFDVIAHPHSESAAAEARAAQIPQEQTAKTVVPHTSAGYRLVVIAASDRLDLHKAAEALEVGAIPPIGSDTPLELVDVRLLDYGHVLCPAGDHEHSLLVDPTDIVRVIGRAMGGHTPGLAAGVTVADDAVCMIDSLAGANRRSGEIAGVSRGQEP